MGIRRGRVIDILFRGHGGEVLEQVALLELVRQRAKAERVALSEADIEKEYDSALAQVCDPLTPASGQKLTRNQQEQVLREMCARRGISREQYMLVIERTAYLRKLAEHDIKVTPEGLEAEFKRSYGPRVQVRHIQVASLRDAAQARERLKSGRSFEAVAREVSKNPVTGPKGGLLPPFTASDDDLPVAFRRAAFALKSAGDVSPVTVRVGQWCHLIRLERRFPPSEVKLEDVREDVEGRLRRRLVRQKMEEITQRLAATADVDVLDPLLREAFLRRHPGGQLEVRKE